jgi:diguanylate cyclase (GGDEF)-like protein
MELAPLISIAVSNAMSYGAIKEESHTDNLTGLKNHRGFMENFLPLLADAYTDGFALSVMVLDIDNFKRINDTYGHQVGNLILIDLAEILRTFFRASDLVGRFGGEEFIVVLNGTPADIAPRIAEQLRRKVESHQFPISLQRDGEHRPGYQQRHQPGARDCFRQPQPRPRRFPQERRRDGGADHRERRPGAVRRQARGQEPGEAELPVPFSPGG